MAGKETRLETGRQRAASAVASILSQLRTARLTSNLSQAAIAAQLGWSQTRYSLFERNVREVTVADVSLVASILGLKLTFDVFRIDEGVRDAGSQRLIERFLAMLASVWLQTREAPFPHLGDLRSWDVLIRLGRDYRVGVEAETRLRDIQELVRRIRQRELHGGADHIIVILSDSQHNRRYVDEFRAALGPNYLTQPGDLLADLRTGRQLPGSGVILL